MNLKELKDNIDRLYNEQMHHMNQQPENITVGIIVKTLGSVGGTPITNIKNITMGFDWDTNKLMICPEKDLRIIEADELLALRKAHEKDGWAQYENRGLKSDIKKLTAKIALLEGNL